MTTYYRRSACLTVLLVLIAGSLQAADISITVAVDREDGMYSVGDEAKFAIYAKRGDTPVTSGEFAWSLTVDGVAKVSSGTAEFGKKPVVVKGSLDEPGILRCTAIYTDGDQTLVKAAGAAFDPTQIQPTATEPFDFAKFWQGNREKLLQVPVDLKLAKSAQHSDAGMTVYKISMANIKNSRVYGWLAVPTSPGPHPAMLTVPYAGVYPQTPGWVSWGRRGFIAMAISVHDYDVDMPQEKYDELADGALWRYPFKGMRHRRGYYFQRTFTGCMRAMDYLTSRPDWDGKNLVVTGSSQGGGLSLICAGLDNRVSAIAANVPALCDHSGLLQGRASGWPGLLRFDEAHRDKTAEAAAYYDAVNFARYIQCPSLIAVGLVDTTCPPTTVYSAYNVINAPKEIMAFPYMGHSSDPKYNAYREQWILDQVFGKRVAPGKMSVSR